MKEGFLTQIEEIIKPVLETNQVNLFSLDFDKATKILTILIEKPDYTMDLSTCVFISNLISELLDVHDLIDFEYTLEVASVGAERPLLVLKDYEDAVGKYINVILKQPLSNNLKQLQGDLISLVDNVLTLECTNKTKKYTANIPLENIEKANLAIKFN